MQDVDLMEQNLQKFETVMLLEKIGKKQKYSNSISFNLVKKYFDEINKFRLQNFSLKNIYFAFKESNKLNLPDGKIISQSLFNRIYYELINQQEIPVIKFNSGRPKTNIKNKNISVKTEIIADVINLENLEFSSIYTLQEIEEDPELFQRIDGLNYQPDEYMQLAQMAVKKDWQNYKYIQVEYLPKAYGEFFYSEVIKYVENKINENDKMMKVEFLQNIQPQYLKNYTNIVNNIIYSSLISDSKEQLKQHIKLFLPLVNNKFYGQENYTFLIKKIAIKMGVDVLNSIAFPIEKETYTDICKYIVSNNKIYDFLDENIVLDKIEPKFLDECDYLEICKIAISKNAENIKYALKQYLPENVNISFYQSKKLGVN